MNDIGYERGEDKYESAIQNARSADLIKIDRPQERKWSHLFGFGVSDSIEKHIRSNIKYFIPEDENNMALMKTWMLPDSYQKYCEWIVDNHVICLDKIQAWSTIKEIDKHLWSQK